MPEGRAQTGASRPDSARWALVLPTSLPKELEHRIVEKRAFCGAMGRQPLQRRQMATPKKIRQICCEEKQLV